MRFAWIIFCLSGCGPKESPTAPDKTSETPAVPGSDASLADWRLSEQAIQPTFASDRVWYAADAGSTEEVTATPTDPLATVELVVRDLDGTELERFDSPSADIALDGGEQIIAVVTSADGTETSEYTLTALPTDFPELEVWNAGEPGPGWYFLCNVDFEPLPNGKGTYLMIIDSLGIPRWIRRKEVITFDFRAGPGDKTTWVELAEDDSVGTIRQPGGALETWVSVGGGIDAHEFQLLENGNILLMAGRISLQDLSQWGGPAQKPILDQVLQELSPAGDLLFEWSTQGQVNLGHIPSVSFLPPIMDIAHANSVTHDPADENWIVSLRVPSQVRKIDRVTGETMWILGGPGSDFEFVNDTRRPDWDGFSTQHAARVTGPNTILVFDNSVYSLDEPTGDSRMAEYELDLDAMTATLINSWELYGSGATAVAGSVQRTPDGHTIVGFGILEEADGARAPAIVDLDENNEPVFELRLPAEHWSYRAYKFDRDESGWIVP